MLDDLSYMVSWLIRWVVVSGFVVKPGTLRHKRTARKSRCFVPLSPKRGEKKGIRGLCIVVRLNVNTSLIRTAKH